MLGSKGAAEPPVIELTNDEPATTEPVTFHLGSSICLALTRSLDRRLRKQRFWHKEGTCGVCSRTSTLGRSELYQKRVTVAV